MTQLILDFLGLAVIFYLLNEICDRYFVPSLEKISGKLKLSSEVTGATFMAIGSSAPEFFTSLFAIFRVDDQASLGAGTIVGSAIFNILVIVGVAALFMGKKNKLTWQPVIRDLTFYSATIGLLLFIFWDKQVEFWETILMVAFYGIYLFMVKNWAKWFDYKLDFLEEEEENCEDEKNVVNKIVCKTFDLVMPDMKKKKNNFWWVFAISIGFIGLLTHFMVELAIDAAHLMNVSEAIIGLTILAAGTSIPDAMSSIIVAKRGKGDMAVTNAVGSNIFDILVGLGFVYFLFFTIKGLDSEVLVTEENLIGSLFLLFATVIAILLVLIMQKWRLGKYSGIFLIVLYLAYLAYNIFDVLGWV